MKIAIIGAGIAGLASAVRMACRGYEVEVFEANDYPGGKLSEFTIDGYRFDAGPSLFTMPHYVDELFELAGEDSRAHFEYVKLPTVCHYFWEDGARLHAHADARLFAQAAADAFNVPQSAILKLLHDGKKKYEITGRIFLEQSLHKISTWLQWKVLKAMLQIPGLDLFTTMNKVHEQSARHPKLVQLFNRFATYNGSNPYKAPGLLSMIPHFEHGIGAFMPRKGMYAITQSIYELALRKGVQFHFNTPVAEITVENGTATGIIAAGQPRRFDRVISNMDVFYTYKKLLPQQPHPERTLKQEKSTSALIFYWGIRRSFPELDLHNILFSDNYRAEFDHLAAGRLYDDPTVYINITSKYCPEDAPEGCENWFTMINVPYDSGQDWEALKAKAREQVLDKISRILGVAIRPLIACEETLDPRGIERKTWSHLGALYGTSSNNRMAAFLRHPNFSNSIRHLYFCGGSAHPGGGIPLCLLSARIVDQVMDHD